MLHLDLNPSWQSRITLLHKKLARPITPRKIQTEPWTSGTKEMTTEAHVPRWMPTTCPNLWGLITPNTNLPTTWAVWLAVPFSSGSLPQRWKAKHTSPALLWASTPCTRCGRWILAYICFQNPEFAPFIKALDSEMKRNRATPSTVRVPKQADSVWEEDIPWQKRLLGSHSPQSLIHTMVFMAGLYLYCIMGKNISSCTKISTLPFVCGVPQEYVSHPPRKLGMPRSLLCRDVQEVLLTPIRECQLWYLLSSTNTQCRKTGVVQESGNWSQYYNETVVPKGWSHWTQDKSFPLHHSSYKALPWRPRWWKTQDTDPLMELGLIKGHVPSSEKRFLNCEKPTDLQPHK